MTFCSNPLSYCTNVHPGLTVTEVQAGLSEFTVPTRERFGELAAGLWLARPVVSELRDSAETFDRFAESLRRSRLHCYTLNTFPYGNFHDTRVKENVYIPDWTTAERYDYTLDCARVLSRLLPDDETEGSLSTVPLGFKGFQHPADFPDRCAGQLIDLAVDLARLREETGKTVRLAIEPEPLCVLETTPETLAFFERLRELAAGRNQLEAASEFLGVCYDVCHQSVEFEDVAASIRSFAAAGVRISKVHITCAIRLEQPLENEPGRTALAGFVEPRYLHQTLARSKDGTIHRLTDLNQETALSPPAEFAAADEWRIHFHVPVNAESLGPLSTTRDDLRRALVAVRDLDYAPHLEVETYTWNVLPGDPPSTLVDGLTAELEATRGLLEEVRQPDS